MKTLKNIAISILFTVLSIVILVATCCLYVKAIDFIVLKTGINGIIISGLPVLVTIFFLVYKIVSSSQTIISKDSLKADQELKEMTWQDLKDFISSLPQEIMAKKASILVDDESQARRLSEPMILANDIYSHVEDSEDCGSLEDLKDFHGENFNINEYELTTKKGTPFLTTDF